MLHLTDVREFRSKSISGIGYVAYFNYLKGDICAKWLYIEKCDTHWIVPLDGTMKTYVEGEIK